MKKVSLIFLLLFAFAFSSCSQEQKPVNDPDPDNITIGTFNIAWLGDGLEDRIKRREEDCKRIAKVIKSTGCDIMGLQEVENSDALERILKYMPEYDYFVGDDGGPLNLAVIYKNTVEMDVIGEYMPVAVKENRTRPGLLFEAKKGNFDFKGMVVHFKSTSRYDDTKQKRIMSINLRKRQSRVVTDWVIETLQDGNEMDLFIIGDFNDSPLRKKDPALTPLYEQAGLRFLTKDLKSCKYSGWYVIDHIAVTPSAAGRFSSDAPMMYNVWDAFPKEKADYISDHCPIYAKFEVTSEDND